MGRISCPPRRRAGVFVIFVNGRLPPLLLTRLSPGDFPLRWRGCRFLKSATRTKLRCLPMQSELDAARLLATRRVTVGRCYRQSEILDLDDPQGSPLSSWIKEELAPRPASLAGSVMANEETLILRAFADVRRQFPERHVDPRARNWTGSSSSTGCRGLRSKELVRRSNLTLNGAGHAVWLNPATICCRVQPEPCCLLH